MVTWFLSDFHWLAVVSLVLLVTGMGGTTMWYLNWRDEPPVFAGDLRGRVVIADDPPEWEPDEDGDLPPEPGEEYAEELQAIRGDLLAEEAEAPRCHACGSTSCPAAGKDYVDDCPKWQEAERREEFLPIEPGPVYEIEVAPRKPLKAALLGDPRWLDEPDWSYWLERDREARDWALGVEMRERQWRHRMGLAA